MTPTSSNYNTSSAAPAVRTVRPAPSPRNQDATPAVPTGHGSGAVEPSPVTAVKTQQAPASGRIDPTSDEASAADPTDDSPDPGMEPDPQASVTEAIVAFTRACGVADLLRLCDALPCGYFMEIPESGAFLDDDEAQRRGFALRFFRDIGQNDGRPPYGSTRHLRRKRPPVSPSPAH